MYEIRFSDQVCGLESRDDGAEYLTGHAAVFYREGEQRTEFPMWEGTTERIKPSAFDRLRSDDYDLTGDFNHDPTYILGRRSAGTMTITVDDVGLHYSIRMASNPIHQFVRDAVQRGDVSGASFVFKNASPARWEADGAMSRRWLTDVHVKSLGPVVNPAYLATSAGMRSLDEARREYDKWSGRADHDECEHDRVSVLASLASLPSAAL
ncbi:MAG: HK97 family phage prohead protease [Planctomycetota bacterium]